MNVNRLLEADFGNRLIQPDGCAYQQARTWVAHSQETGALVVANAGAYDLLSLNHIRGLAQCRAYGAAALAAGRGDTSAGEEDILRLACSDSVMLLVSMDTNLAVEDGKSHNPAKGGSVKPVLDWETRARMVAAQSMPISGSTMRRAAVDFITRHGPGACTACPHGRCPQEDPRYSVAWLDPDLTVIKRDAHTTAVVAANRPKAFVVVDEDKGAYHDTLLRGQISTTALIRRIRG